MSYRTPERPHIVFLFSDTGGGHRSAAQAIIEALNLEFPGRTTQEMVDVFREYAPPPLSLAPDIYPPLSRMPKVWGMGYHMSDGPRRTRFLYQMLWPYIRWGMSRLVREHPCDLLVSVHQLINDPVARAVAGSQPGIPFVTVVTDLVSTHAAWYTNRASLIIVPTAVAYKRAQSLGIHSERMKVAGLPVADRFCRPCGDRGIIRSRLGWRADLPVVLLVGGGEGMGPLEPVARAIDSARLPVQLVVIAGRNKQLKERLEKQSWRTLVKIYGFIQEMPDFMRAADILVTKAGPGTISEAFIAGLPLILFSRLPGQEDGNVDYVVDNHAGVWAPRPETVAAVLRHWLDSPEQCEKARAASLRLARPRAAREIAHLLAAQVNVQEAPEFSLSPVSF
jgi:1,2-diacylglycerol 3-beta-galactosyltransferase